MSMFYSKSSGGFYDTDVHGEDIPSDAVSVSQDAYTALFVAQAAGKVIGADANGNPIAVDPPALTSAQLNAPVKAALDAIDELSIRGIREWLIAQSTCPQITKDHEAAAVAERAKLV